MKRITLWTGALFFLGLVLNTGGCMRLDGFMFNEDNSIKSYKFDNYTGEVDFVLGPSYNIPPANVNLFTLNSKNGNKSAKIYAVYIGNMATITTDRVIVYCHGNRDHMDFYWQRAKLLANLGSQVGYGVLMMDYQGYGLSGGKASEANLYNDVDAALSWVKAQGVADNRIILYGFSLGTAPATELMANPRSATPAMLVLEAPFASSEVFVQDSSVLALPGSYMFNIKINNATEIKKVTQPFVWLHGKADNFIPMKTHGEVVFGNYGGSNALAIRVDKAGHGTIPQKMGFANYLSQLDTFIVSVVP